MISDYASVRFFSSDSHGRSKLKSLLIWMVITAIIQIVSCLIIVFIWICVDWISLLYLDNHDVFHEWLVYIQFDNSYHIELTFVSILHFIYFQSMGSHKGNGIKCTFSASFYRQKFLHVYIEVWNKHSSTNLSLVFGVCVVKKSITKFGLNI